LKRRESWRHRHARNQGYNALDVQAYCRRYGKTIFRVSTPAFVQMRLDRRSSADPEIVEYGFSAASALAAAPCAPCLSEIPPLRGELLRISC
jgi:hypothetical protein